MISPMMVMTTRISTSVKPACRRRDRRRRVAEVRTVRPTSVVSSNFPHLLGIYPLADNLAHGHQRRHDRHDQSPDDDADYDDRRGSGNSNHAIERTLQLCLVEFGN